MTMSKDQDKTNDDELTKILEEILEEVFAKLPKDEEEEESKDEEQQ
jgi:hypothetical protein